jgi:phosphate/sulfate permease
MDIFLAAVCMLLVFAVFDLVVGVSNDAANFLNSSIGSRVAPRKVIMLIASLGILVGVTFSSGMMEVARKGIFHPQFFTMPELIAIFMAVMLTDILLLDLFNTFGMPTSTTVSIVFELLGAAVAVSVIKIMAAGDAAMDLGEYINTSKAMMISFGILISIAISFCCGALVMFFTRLLFTFDFEKRMKRYGALWGGVALTTINFFILIKGAKGASFITPEALWWIKSHSLLIMVLIFIVSTITLQLLMTIFRINILKPVVLFGTFALAMAFAANDLVNFIGVPLAGLYAYTVAMAASDPLHGTMGALSAKVPSQTALLLLAGAIMVITLWVSKKARSVSETEIRLGQQEEGTERFESIWLSRSIVGMGDSFANMFLSIVPHRVRSFVSHRIDPQAYRAVKRSGGQHPSFDLIRASVNLMVASAVVAYATSMKLPLSTTYVTFMVAMGTSFADQAWGRESAVYRITGVLTVIGGWFLTAFIAFAVAFVFANVIHYLQAWGVAGLLLFAGFVIWKNHHEHRGRVKSKEDSRIYNLHNVQNARLAVSGTFEHLTCLLKEIRESFDVTFEALFNEDADALNLQRKKSKQIQEWANIIMANVFKALRIMQKEDAAITYKYAQIIRRLQKLSDGHRDIVLRSFVHLSNKHRGLLAEQVVELREVKACILDILQKVEESFAKGEITNYQAIVDQYANLRDKADQFNQVQIERIFTNTSKTRLSILFYAIVGDCIMMAKQNIKLIEIFNESFHFDKQGAKSYIDLDTA